MHDIGKEGHIQRVAGQRKDGSWDTQKWLISKDDAHLEGSKLIPDNNDAKQVLDQISPVRHLEGDRFSGQG